MEIVASGKNVEVDCCVDGEMEEVGGIHKWRRSGGGLWIIVLSTRPEHYLIQMTIA